MGLNNIIKCIFIGTARCYVHDRSYYHFNNLYSSRTCRLAILILHGPLYPCKSTYYIIFNIRNSFDSAAMYTIVLCKPSDILFNVCINLQALQ